MNNFVYDDSEEDCGMNAENMKERMERPSSMSYYDYIVESYWSDLKQAYYMQKDKNADSN